MNNVTFLDGDGIKRFTIVSGSGTQQDPYIFVFTTPDGNPILVTFIDEVAAPLPSSPSGIIGLIRSLWGSLLTISNNFGALVDAASVTGSLLARLRYVANAFSPPIRYISIGTELSKVLSVNPASIISIYIYNKAQTVRFLQLFNQIILPSTGTVPTETFAIAPNEKYTLDTTDFGIGGTLFSNGLTWGLSMAENVYMPASATDVTIIIRWKSN